MIKQESPCFVRGQSEDTESKKEFELMRKRLLEYRNLNREIDNEIERLERLEDRASSPSSPNLSGMPKAPSPATDRMADTVARILDLRDEIEELVSIRNAERANIESLVKRLDKADERAVIRMRYLDLEEWEDIQMMIFGGKEDYCDKFDNYRQRVFRLHNAAIGNLSRMDGASV